MAKALSIEWLQSAADDDDSLELIDSIIRWRDKIIGENLMTSDKEIFRVNLNGRQVCFRKSSAFSSIEVYEEIFKENNHFLFPGFTGEQVSTVVDIGANSGYYSMRIKERCPECRVIAVEPNPLEFEILQKNFESNNLVNFTVVNKAIAAYDGTMDFEIVEGVGAIGGRDVRMIDRKWMKDEFIKKIKVDCIKLETLCKQYQLDKIDILKVDVEGMELDILKGSDKMLQKCRRIVVERHSRQIRDELMKMLGSQGFELVFQEDADCIKYYGDMYFVNLNP